MGTPDFAVGTLKALIDAGHEVIGVVTQPDKPKGRGKTLMPTPVKEVALRHQIPVYQPKKVREEKFAETLRKLAPDVIVVVAFGQILSRQVLDIPRLGCVNVHASLLPKYRGAAPIQWAILDGETCTGVTTMLMDEGIDTGDILYAVRTKIGINETSAELFERLAALGADALIQALSLVQSGNVVPVKQTGESSYAHMIDKTLCPIDWSKSAFEVHNKIRGLQTWPCAETLINGKRVKIHASVLCEGRVAKAGEVISSNGELIVSCGDGKCISITSLQLEGKKIMDIRSYLAGNPLNSGLILGE